MVFDEWDIQWTPLPFRLYTNDLHSTKWSKVTQTLPLQQLTKITTYRGVAFNFDAKRVLTDKKAIDNWRRIVTVQVISMKMAKKSPGLKTFIGVSYYFYDSLD